MTKNETQLIVRRTEVTNTVGFTSGAKRAPYRCWIVSAALATVFSVAACEPYEAVANSHDLGRSEAGA
jgi:hypothetical protein